jgi:putative ABC transport system permease protein
VIAPRWRKVWRDLGEGGLGRSALVVAALAAGMFGVAMILTSYSIMGRTLSTMYASTRPAAAVLEANGLDDAMVDSVRRVAGVADAELRGVIRARLRVGEDQWIPLVLVVVRDFADLRVDRFDPEAGAWPPAAGEMLIERSALQVAKASIGDAITVKTAEGPARTLRIAGSVHAPGLPPAWMEHMVTGWVPWSSLMRGDSLAEDLAIRIRTAADPFDSAAVRVIADRAGARLAALGIAVDRIDLPSPRHPHADQMDTFRYLLGAFGALTFLLGAVLTANMIHALLIKQARQVGVMKALGARSGQIAGLYLAQVGVLATIALVIGLPLGAWAGLGYARFTAEMLNATLTQRLPDPWVIALEIAIGLGLPLLAALGPVVQASRRTVHQALTQDYGHRPFGARRLDAALARIGWLPRPLRLPLRTTFERRGRLALTVGMLAAGGAAFIAALNVDQAWKRVIADDFGGRRYDVMVRLAHPQPIAALAPIVASVPDVVRAEYWAAGAARLIGAVGEDDSVAVLAPDPGSTLLELPLIRGRWLRADDRGVAVVSQTTMARAPALRIGGPIRLGIGGREVTWTLVGVVREMGGSPLVYGPRADLLAASGNPGTAVRGVRVVTRRHDPASQTRAAGALERAFERAGMAVNGITPMIVNRRAIEDHLVIIVAALVLGASLVVLVGGLGLASTLALAVVERTREIGVLGAIGAGPRQLGRMIVFEAVVIGVLSWLVAILGSVPATLAIASATGRMFIRTPLAMTMSPFAIATWLVLVVALSAFVGLHPARRAARLEVREALAHE